MSRFLPNVLKLGSGNIAAQIISLAAVPVITRIYSPEEYGAFAFVLSLVLVLFPVSTLRLNSAILLPEDERTAEGLMLMSLFSVVVSAALIMPLLLVALHYFGNLDEVTRVVLWYLVAGVLVHGFVQTFEFWLLRHRRYETMAWGAISESVTDRVFAISMGLVLHAIATWLVLGRVVGGIVHLIVFVKRAGHAGVLPGFGVQHLKECPSILLRYKNFPLYSTWAFLLANGARELPTVVLAGMFSPAIAGLYGVGVRVMGFPMLIVGDAIAKVFFRYAVSMSAEPKRLCESSRILLRFLVYLMFPPMLLLVLYGPQLFGLVFGAEWGEAGVFVQILAISFLVAFLYRVLSIFFDMFDQQASRLVFDAIQFASRIGGMLLCGMFLGVEGALWALLISTLVVQGLGIAYLMSLIGLNAAQAYGVILRALVNLLPVSIALAIAGSLPEHAEQFAVVLAGVVLQALWLVQSEPRLAAMIREWRK